MGWYSPASLWWAGLAAVMAYASLRIAWPSVGEGAGTLMALTGLVAVLTWGRSVRGSAPLWLLLGIVVVQLVSWSAGYLHHPDWMPSNPKLDRLGRWFLFIGVAWWLGGSTRYTLWVWSLAVLGLLLATWVPEGSLASWQHGLSGVRVDFGIHNAQHGAMFFASALIGLLCFAPRCLISGKWVWPRRVLWFVALVMCLVGVVITQTRAVWLAVLLVLPVIALVALLYRYASGHDGRWGKPLVLGLLGLGLVLGLSTFAFKGTVQQRLSAENEIIAQVIRGDWDNVPYSSVGNRIHSWRAGVEWFQERPLVGWGENGRSLVIEHTDWLPDRTRQNFGHLHNTLLEVLVSYGLLGLFVLGALVAWVGLGTWRAWRGGVMPGDMALFGYGFFVFYLIVNQFEAYGSFWSGVYVQNLIAGGLVTHIWRWQVLSGQPVFRITAKRTD